MNEPSAIKESFMHSTNHNNIIMLFMIYVRRHRVKWTIDDDDGRCVVNECMHIGPQPQDKRAHTRYMVRSIDMIASMRCVCVCTCTSTRKDKQTLSIMAGTSPCYI